MANFQEINNPSLSAHSKPIEYSNFVRCLSVLV